MNAKQLKRILLIDCGDATFSIFFRSYNLFLNRLKKRDEELEQTDLSLNEEFFDIMKKQYLITTKRLKYKYNVAFRYIFFIKDSPTEQNWRRNIYTEYKANRKETKYKSKSFNLGNLFKRIYAELLPQISEKYGINIIQVDKAEADDVISIITKSTPDNTEIYIISSDTDYLQLLSRENTFIYSISGKLVNEKLGNETAQDKLLYKIMYGDKTDNIPPCIPNNKLIKYYLENPKYLMDTLNINDDVYNKFKRNRILIDFDYIPNNIKSTIVEYYNEYIITNKDLK